MHSSLVSLRALQVQAAMHACTGSQQLSPAAMATRASAQHNLKRPSAVQDSPLPVATPHPPVGDHLLAAIPCRHQWWLQLACRGQHHQGLLVEGSCGQQEHLLDRLQQGLTGQQQCSYISNSSSRAPAHMVSWEGPHLVTHRCNVGQVG